MNYSLASLEIAVVLLGLGLLLLDLWAPETLRRRLGCIAALGLGAILVFSFSGAVVSDPETTAFGGMFIQDTNALFFKRLFLVAGILVLLLASDFADRILAGHTEYASLVLFALAGMMCAASANDLALLFVSVELITVSFYVLVSYQRNRLTSLEAGVKYLILGALSSAFLVFGIALVYGTTGALRFPDLAVATSGQSLDPLLQVGLLLILAGLAFKIAAVPMQIWAPDVYQGAPTPSTAFLAIGSKAAGFVLLIRFLTSGIPQVAASWNHLLAVIAGATLLYGNLAAIPQRGLKRIMGYSSIAHAGYLLLGLVALSSEGRSAMLFYLAAYLFAVLTVFSVLSAVLRDADSDDISAVAGLHRRSPFLATALTLGLLSLAGIPPLAGFFGKFLLLKALLAHASRDPASYWLTGAALFGIVVSFYYYLGIVRAVYWGEPLTDKPAPEIRMGRTLSCAVAVCVVALLVLGLAPGTLVSMSQWAVTAVR